jgi:Flp pilus assembly CpaF family ATPase
MIQPLGRTIDVANPMVDARLSDGSRLNAVIPPLSIKGPVLTIRKFKDDLANIDDLLRTGTLTPYMARFLVEERVVVKRHFLMFYHLLLMRMNVLLRLKMLPNFV